MSRVGKIPVVLPDGVTIVKEGRKLHVKGPKGELSYTHEVGVMVVQQENQWVVTRENDEKRNRILHGLTRALVANMVQGVAEGFSKQLNLVGIGYTVEQKGSDILLNLGYSHAIYFQAPPEIKFEVSNRNTTLVVSGIDKQLVGQVSAKIRALRKPEPYKGKGVRYSDEVVHRKAGKTVGGGDSSL